MVELSDALERVGDFPEAWPLVDDGVRKVAVGRFPFAVYYVIRNASVVVVGVIHGSREPISWRTRIKADQSK